MNPLRLSKALSYRLDGLGDGAEYARWRLVFADRHRATFAGPAGETIHLVAQRLYEIRAGHLHYVRH